VSLASGPPGWALTTTDDGWEVGGAALEPRQDAVFNVTIVHVPPELTRFPLKTLLRYADGAEDACIEEATANNPRAAAPGPRGNRGPGGVPFVGIPLHRRGDCVAAIGPEARAEPRSGGAPGLSLHRRGGWRGGADRFHWYYSAKATTATTKRSMRTAPMAQRDH